MRPINRLLIPVLFSFLITQCGTVSSVTVDDETAAEDLGETDGESDETPSEAEESPTSSIFAFATDFGSAGQLYQGSASGETVSFTNTGITSLGSSAVVRTASGKVYVLHDGWSFISTDNLTIFDSENSFAVLGQHSTGNGTNPHDVVAIDARAFISLYNPSADVTNLDGEGNPGDVIEMDTTSGSITHRYSFQQFLADDGDKNANADQMVLVDDILYVALQDLESGTFAATTSGKIGMIDTVTHEVLGVIELSGRNPVSLAASPDGSTLFVANMATYDFMLGNFDTSTDFGGLEIVDLESESSILLLADDELGGYIERVRASADRVFAVASNMDPVNFNYTSVILSANLDADSLDDITTYEDDGADIRDIVVNGDFLWVSRRVINNDGASSPHIGVYNLETNNELATQPEPLVPVTSMSGN